MREFLKPFEIEVLYEKIHTKADLEKFVEMARRNPNVPYIHYVGHGDFRGRAKLKLTFDFVDLKKDVGVFSDLEGKVFIFSCCTVGKDKAAMKEPLKVSRAKAVISYDRDIDDAYAFLTEGILYSRIFDTRWRPQRIVQKVKSALQYLQVKRDVELRNSQCPLVCFSVS